MDIQTLFKKPEIPVEVRVPDVLIKHVQSREMSVSRVLKLGVYALLEAEEQKQASMKDILFSEDIKKIIHEQLFDGHKLSGATLGRRVTIRVPLDVFSLLSERIPEQNASQILARIAQLYALTPELLDHV